MPVLAGVIVKIIRSLLVLAFVVAACGDLASGRQARTSDLIEAELLDPPAYDRTSVELVDEETGILKHQGGYEVRWSTLGQPPPWQVADDFVPLLRAAGYEVEPDEEYRCDEGALRMFLVHEGHGFIGSARLTYIPGDDVVLQAGWDNRSGETFIGDTLVRDSVIDCEGR